MKINMKLYNVKYVISYEIENKMKLWNDDDVKSEIELS